MPLFRATTKLSEYRDFRNTYRNRPVNANFLPGLLEISYFPAFLSSSVSCESQKTPSLTAWPCMYNGRHLLIGKRETCREVGCSPDRTKTKDQGRRTKDFEYTEEEEDERREPRRSLMDGKTSLRRGRPSVDGEDVRCDAAFPWATPFMDDVAGGYVMILASAVKPRRERDGVVVVGNGIKGGVVVGQ